MAIVAVALSASLSADQNVTMANPKSKTSIGRDVIFPILVWVIIIVVFLNVRNIPYEFTEKNKVVLRYFVKFVMTILFPLALIHLFYKDKNDFGIYFSEYSQSIKLTWRALSVVGPACLTFLLIGLVGWGFDDWKGATTLTGVFLVVFYFLPKITNTLPTRNRIDAPNNRITSFALMSALTLVIAYFTYAYIPIISKMGYYIFIVAFGEELFFRGYFQSSLNRYFGKPFNIAGVPFGWGLFLAAAMFGLSHAVVTSPPAWPWAMWTAIFGLSLGFVREKDGSILAAVLLHAIAILPLAFMD